MPDPLAVPKVGIFAAEHPSRESAVHADARCPLVGALARLGHHGLERGWVYTMTERYLPRWGAQEPGDSEADALRRGAKMTSRGNRMGRDTAQSAVCLLRSGAPNSA